VPTIEEQERITKQLNFVTDQVQRLETAYQAKLTALDELKQSLLHQAFSGQL
jgi:type I restriction enzyme S subunit